MKYLDFAGGGRACAAVKRLPAVTVGLALAALLLASGHPGQQLWQTLKGVAHE